MTERTPHGRGRWFVFAILFLFIAAGLPGLRAQSATSVVRGTVSDASGARLPGVSVTLASPALQVKQITVASESDGSYRFSDLPAGIYRVTFELAGFNTFVRDELRLTIGFTAQVDATMTIGAV